MKIRRILTDNPQVTYVINRIQKQSRAASLDVLGAYNLLCEGADVLNEHIQRRLEWAYILCKYMDPDAEDVVAMLLFHDNSMLCPSIRTLVRYMGEKRAEMYHKQIYEVCKDAPANKDLSDEDRIAYYVMLRVCDKMMGRCMKILNRNRLPNTFLIADAYTLAREAHMFKLGANGVPTLLHPLRVVGSLAQFGVESSVIAAAILRASPENIVYPVDKIYRVCGAKVAQYVEALSLVQNDGFARYPAVLADQKIDKLLKAIRSSRDMIFALYILAVDRIHVLKEIESSDPEAVQELSEETQRHFLPLFKGFKLNYFVREIENLVWRAADVERYTQLQMAYEDMVARNDSFLQELKSLFVDYIHLDLNRYALIPEEKEYEVEVIERRLLPYEVYECLKHADKLPCNLTKAVRKSVVPICDIDIVVDPQREGNTLETFITSFVRMFNNRIVGTGRTILDFSHDSSGAFVLSVGDSYRNVFRCRIVKRIDYDVQKSGIFTRSAPDELEDGKAEKISIVLRNDKLLLLPKGATVIDAAFAIHEELGYAVKSATINGHKSSIYKTLSDGDRVIIEADTKRSDGITSTFIPHARISWLNYVVTKKAKKMIISFLSDRYEGDDPKYENEAETQLVESAADRILAELSRSKQMTFTA